MTVNFEMEESVQIGIIQTTLDANLAWEENASLPQISSLQDAHVWQELCKAFQTFQDNSLQPRIILIPELSLPRTRIADFKNLIGSLNVIAIAGLDYKFDSRKKTIKNQGNIFVPCNFFKKMPSRYCSTIAFGKTYPAPTEVSNLKNKGWNFEADQNVYVIDCACYGRIGISICYDFMDIERALMYRGRIQHLFVIAYNKDIEMFRSLANTLSRTIYCNVIICNTGYYGGSVATAPYYDAWKRIIYEHNGNGLFTTQVIKLPVKSLYLAQNGDAGKGVGKNPIWKHPAPGVEELMRRNSTHLYRT